MLFGLGRRMIAAGVVLSMLSGCAEIDRRGGFIDEVEDTVFFRADTKTHRLLRSYLLATVLLTTARRQGHNDVDRTAIAGALEGALAVANEAYMCLYPGLFEIADASTAASFPVDSTKLRLRTGLPSDITSWRSDGSLLDVVEPVEKPRWCQFFDERMSRLDYALFRLASVTLFNSESRDALSDIQAKLVGKIPVVTDTVAAAIHVNRAANQVTSIVDDLLTVSFKSAAPVLALLPLYRDSLELNMWVITDNFALACKRESPSTLEALEASIFAATDGSPACANLVNAIFALQRGNGNPKIWRDFLGTMNVLAENDLARILPIEAYRSHFFLISQLLVRSCRNVLSDAQKPKRCDDVLADALEKAAFNADNATGNLINTGSPNAGRWLTAMLPLPGAKYAQMRGRGMPRMVSKPQQADPSATGSIGQPSTPPAAPAKQN